MASGIEVNPEITDIYNTMKLKNTHKFMLFHIKDKKSIEIEYRSDPAATVTKDECRVHFETMKGRLTNEPRYLLYDFGIDGPDGRKIKKLVFIFWCPDNGKIGDKMVYASSKDSLKKALTGIGIEFQANDHGDMDFEEMAQEVIRKS